MLNCREATRLMSLSMEQKLTVSQRLQLKFHLAMCRGCRNFGRQTQALRELAKEYRNKQK
ncbi:zf-HC2 domain-containing protein [Bermanella marisrubri]|uniref:Putative zinc-finger domain-containing protein n=1 Tax=Bermanella marisrubri TaxID=207949 RepID=Q1MYW8_9GAMM|nr:zf-HC2 domain-containing protein [Bermanella marisrubri]EAT11173.1 hypothetical protein RED65_07809 [Oceanobacter sp. RED65] [Bermanella marisrubri]QIZ83377.1 zf-HC2 domain-containing protein [Bermanella marisrubri]